MDSLIVWLQQHDRRFIYGGGIVTFMHRNKVQYISTEQQARELLAELKAES